jgi:hypothetical protein
MSTISMDYIEKHPKCKAPPVVLPLVFAQNKNKWRLLSHFGPELYDLTEAQRAAFGRFIPGFDFVTIETAKLGYDEMRGTPLGALVLRVMKAQREGALASDVIWDSPVFWGDGEAGKSGDFTPEQLRRLLLYMLHTGLAKPDFERRVAALPKPKQDLVMTAAQEYIQIGKQEGIQIGESRGIQIGESRGIQIGEQKGKLVGYIRAAQELLTLNPIPENVLFAKSIEELQRISDDLRAKHFVRQN